MAAPSTGNYASINVTNANVNVTNANLNDLHYEVAGQGTSTSVRFFDPSAAAAYATFTWRMPGSGRRASRSRPFVLTPARCAP